MTTTVPPKTVASIRWLAAPRQELAEQAMPAEELIDHATRTVQLVPRCSDVPLPV